MFGNATLFNQPLNNWDVSSVTNMIMMFSCAKSFNQPFSFAKNNLHLDMKFFRPTFQSSGSFSK